MTFAGYYTCPKKTCLGTRTHDHLSNLPPFALGRVLSGGPVHVQLAAVLARRLRRRQRRNPGVDASALHLVHHHRLHRPLHLRRRHQRSR